MYQQQCTVLENSPLNPNLFKLCLRAPVISSRAKPGQFVHLSLGTRYDPLLRRPMSIAGVEGDSLYILYQVVGRGTKHLSSFQPGTILDVLGPLGNGFTIQGVEKHVLLAGGIGVAPLLFLAEHLVVMGEDVHFFVGMKDQELECLQEFIPDTLEVIWARERSVSGKGKMVTELLKSHLPLQPSTCIYSCGPLAMYREMARLLAPDRDIQVQISLDRHMGCGVGTCLSCVQKIKQPDRQQPLFQRTCREGPVFLLEEVVLV